MRPAYVMGRRAMRRDCANVVFDEVVERRHTLSLALENDDLQGAYEARVAADALYAVGLNILGTVR
jgi:hypothetical protein